MQDCMQYSEGMEIIESDIMDRVLKETQNFDYLKYTSEDVMNALNSETCTIEDYKALLSPCALEHLEEIANKAKRERAKHFGNSVYLFTPLYISNYCENHCVYCGFNCTNKIKRAKLTLEEIEEELKSINNTGLEEILILTGENQSISDVNYICEAVKLARKYFKMIGLEVFPMNADEYTKLQKCGADYITVFQETYNPNKYSELHLSGAKRCFPYRFNAQERAIKAGMRGVAFAALLGLDDYRKDAFATGLHAFLLQKKYPQAEISFSCPRLRPIINNNKIDSNDVKEKELLQIIMAYRIFMPYAGLTISTRERAIFRDNILSIAATKISAGVSTGIGSHNKNTQDKGDDQFIIADNRTVQEVYNAVKRQGMQPVMNEYVYV